MNGCNARQLLLKHNKAHGSGCDLEFPNALQIAEAMGGFDLESKIPIYGDGGYTTPMKWWVALGGYGIWVPTMEYKHR